MSQLKKTLINKIRHFEVKIETLMCRQSELLHSALGCCWCSQSPFDRAKRPVSPPPPSYHSSLFSAMLASLCSPSPPAVPASISPHSTPHPPFFRWPLPARLSRGKLPQHRNTLLLPSRSTLPPSSHPTHSYLQTPYHLAWTWTNAHMLV